MVAKKEIAPELLAEAKRLYEQTLAPVGDIAEMVGLSRSNFYERVREGGWRSRRAKPTFNFARALSDGVREVIAPESAERLRAEPAVCIEPVSPQQRMAIAQRIMNVVEREMDAVERIIETIKPTDQLEAEHGARTLATVSRMLRESAALIRPVEETPPNEADDDPVPRDIDEFRNELARRIHAIIDMQETAEGRGSGNAAGLSDGPRDRRLPK